MIMPFHPKHAMKTVALMLLLSSLWLNVVHAANGADFNAGNIMSDAVMSNAASMSVADIQNFLNSKVSSCDSNGTKSYSYHYNSVTGAVDGPNDPVVTTSRATYGQRYDSYYGSTLGATPYICLKDYSENSRSAAQIIWDKAQQYNINPRSLIVLLQKEQGLVADDWPWPNQYQHATGYGCPDGAPCDAQYFGFTNQLANAASLYRHVLNQDPNWYSPYSVGNNTILWSPNRSCGSSTVSIQNWTTAALYDYTPYRPNQAALSNLYGSGDGCSAYGNRNFWRDFTDWFGSTQPMQPYAWSVASQGAWSNSGRTTSFTDGITVAPGQVAYVTVQARNNGYQTWSQASLHLGTNRPQDRTSAFSDGTWISSSRIAMQESSVLPGGVATFSFDLKAPAQTGSYRECFNVLAEGITWMNDLGLCFGVDVVNPISASNASNVRLNSGQALNVGQYLLSPDTQSLILLQPDGNLVDYSDFQPAWATYAFSRSPKQLVMQSDGNLVEYDTSNNPVWNSQTGGHPGAYAIVQTDGNFVVYDASNQPLWANYAISVPDHLSRVNKTLTAKLYPGQSLDPANRKVHLVLQPDGNLVLYDANRHPLWAAGTDGRSAIFLAMQPDGNLVLYDANRHPLWATYTQSHPGATLWVQDDGNLVLYDANMRPLWNTGTGN